MYSRIASFYIINNKQKSPKFTGHSPCDLMFSYHPDGALQEVWYLSKSDLPGSTLKGEYW